MCPTQGKHEETQTLKHDLACSAEVRTIEEKAAHEATKAAANKAVPETALQGAARRANFEAHPARMGPPLARVS